MVTYIVNNMDPDQTARDNFKLEIFYQLPLIMDHSNIIKKTLNDGRLYLPNMANGALWL